MMIRAGRSCRLAVLVTSTVAAFSTISSAQVTTTAPAAAPAITASEESLRAWQYEFSEADVALLEHPRAAFADVFDRVAVALRDVADIALVERFRAEAAV